MKFKLKCKSLSGEISIIEVNAADRIDQIKRNLSKIVKIKHENIGFLYRNQFLFNDTFVSDYQIGNEEIVVYYQYENCVRYSISDSVDDRLRYLNINIDQVNNKLINVWVKNFSNQIYIFALPKRSIVVELKQMFANRIKLEDTSWFEFQFQGVILSDMNNLEYYDINDGDTITAMVKVVGEPPYLPILSILPLTDGYDKLELRDVVNIDQIINHIHNRYNNIDKINIQLYNNADKTGLIINITDILGHRQVYYCIEHEIDKYEICTKLVGVGSFGGVTFRCKENSSSEIYVVKQFKISKENNSKINIEKQLASFLSLEKHPRIIELIKQFNDIDLSYLLMEYIDGGSIESIRRRNEAIYESELAKYAQQILEGLEYLHISRIIHGNIKGSNILIDKNGNVKLSDFGLRTIFHNISNRNLFDERLQSEIGAINWLSPEMIRGGQLVPASDIWSFGAVMVEMITGQIPHYGLSVGQIVFAIMKGQIQFRCPVLYKDHVKSFISICLKVQPRERANFDDLYEHSFLK